MIFIMPRVQTAPLLVSAQYFRLEKEFARLVGRIIFFSFSVSSCLVQAPDIFQLSADGQEMYSLVGDHIRGKLGAYLDAAFDQVGMKR